MTDPDTASAQAEVNIDADPDTVYALITDLPTLATLAEEAAAMDWRKGDAVRPGAVFKGHNRNGIFRWSTTCTVTDAEPGRLFAFDVRYLGPADRPLALRHRREAGRLSRHRGDVGPPSRLVRQDGVDRHRGPRPHRGERRAHQGHTAAAEAESRKRPNRLVGTSRFAILSKAIARKQKVI